MEEPQGNTPAESQSETVAVSKTELDKLRAMAKEHDIIVQDATNLGYVDVMAMHEDLVNYGTPEPTPTPTPEPVKQPEVKPNPPTPIPAVVPPDVPTRNDLARLEQATIRAQLDGQFAVFQQKQGQLPEAERATGTRQDLDRLLNGPDYALVAQLVQDPQYEGNYYAAAARLKHIAEHETKARKAGAASARAMNAAAETASVGTGAVPAADTKPEQTPDRALAEAIAPTEGYYTGD